MLRYIVIALLAIPFNAVEIKAQTLSHLMVSKVKVSGYDCSTTSYFEICPSYSEIQGKILYMTDAHYLKNQSTLTFMFKDDGTPLVSKLKELRNKATEWNLVIEMVAEPESFHVCREPILSCIGEDWDGYEECAIIYIKFPLAWCMTEKQVKYKNRCKYFREILKKGKFKTIRVECGKEKIEIPLEFPLNETIREIEKLNN